MHFDHPAVQKVNSCIAIIIAFYMTFPPQHSIYRFTYALVNGFVMNPVVHNEYLQNVSLG